MAKVSDEFSIHVVGNATVSMAFAFPAEVQLTDLKSCPKTLSYGFAMTLCLC
jgi:hypothetical protein